MLCLVGFALQNKLINNNYSNNLQGFWTVVIVTVNRLNVRCTCIIDGSLTPRFLGHL